MIRHIVFWKLKQEAEGASAEENGKKLAALFSQLQGKIEGLISIDSGLDFNRSDAAYDFALSTTFETEEALNFYQAHPEHQKIVAFVRNITSERRVVDYHF